MTRTDRQRIRNVMRCRNGTRVQRRRGGAVLMVVVLCLLVVSMILANMANRLVSQRRDLNSSRRQLQSVCLANSGVDRAIVASENDADYQGETWEIAARELPADAVNLLDVAPAVLNEEVAARVTITVTTSDSRRRVVVVADYPLEPRYRVRTERTVFLTNNRS